MDIYGNIYGRMYNEDYCVRLPVPPWSVSSEHVEQSGFYYSYYWYSEYDSTIYFERLLRREGFESLQSVETSAIGFWSTKFTNCVKLHLESYGAIVPHSFLGAVRDHHLRHHRLGAVLWDPARDVLPKRNER